MKTLEAGGAISAKEADLTTLARGGFVNLLGSASQALFGFGILFALGRGLGAAATGAFVEAIAVFSIATAAATFGVDTGFVRAISKLRAEGRVADLRSTLLAGYVPVVGAGLLAAALIMLSSDAIASMFGDGRHAGAVGRHLVAMAPLVPLGALASATLGATRGYEMMIPTVVLDRIGKPAVQFVLVALGVLAGVAAQQLALAWAAPVAVVALGAGWWLRTLLQRDTAEREASSPSCFATVAREFWSFTLPRAAASIFRVVVQWLDVLLVGGLVSPTAAGVYAVSTRLLQFGVAMAYAVGQITQPMFSRLLAHSDVRQTRTLYETATSWQILMVWPQYIILALFAPALLRLFGEEFAAGAPVVAILATSLMVGSAVGPVDMVLLMAGKSMWSFWNTASSLSANIALNIILIPRIGIAGAALAWAASRLIDNIVPLIQVSLFLGLHPFGRKWLRAVAATTVTFGGMGAGAQLVLGQDVAVALGIGILATGSYVVCLRSMREQLELNVAFGALRRRYRAAAPLPGA